MKKGIALTALVMVFIAAAAQGAQAQHYGEGPYGRCHYGMVIPPFIYIESPENKTYITTIIDLNVTTSSCLGVGSLWYEFNKNGTNTSFTPNTTLVASGGDGFKTLTVWANDTAGIENSSEVGFTIDTLAPEVTIISP